jgi:hypothetical protein
MSVDLGAGDRGAPSDYRAEPRLIGLPDIHRLQISECGQSGVSLLQCRNKALRLRCHDGDR